ncbi:MAG: class I SAM-dependent methyltransferase [Solirubrobacteraceae bacterium]
MPAGEWSGVDHVRRYLARADEFPHRAEGEKVLLDNVAPRVGRVLDLGTGDGRLLALLACERPHLRGVGLDVSDVMLDAARARFEGEEHIELVQHDMVSTLPELGRFDAVVSSMAIHHLEHDRKRELYAEVFGVLEPGGVFANFEHVASPTQRLHVAFYAAIDEPLEHEDLSDRLLDVETQVGYLRDAGFTDVDCYWKWLEMALLIGVRPPAPGLP